MLPLRPPPSSPLAHLLALLWPSACLGCGIALPFAGDRFGLCPACRDRLPLAGTGCVACARHLPLVRSRCASCRRAPPPWRSLSCLYLYEPPVPAIVAALKFGRRESLGGDLGEELAPLVAAGAPQADVVTAVPLPWLRLVARGYNQAEALARPLARRLGLSFRPLLRRRHRPAQRGLSRQDRLANLAGAFVGRGAEGRRVLLVDDVLTTGATLRSATAALLAAGAASVAVAVVARTPRRAGSAGPVR